MKPLNFMTDFNFVVLPWLRLNTPKSLLVLWRDIDIQSKRNAPWLWRWFDSHLYSIFVRTKYSIYRLFVQVISFKFFFSIPVNALRRVKKQTRARKAHICAYVWLFGYFPIVVNFFYDSKDAIRLCIFSVIFFSPFQPNGYAPLAWWSTHTRPISNKQRKFQPK